MHPSAAQFRWPAIYSKSKVIYILLQCKITYGLNYFKVSQWLTVHADPVFWCWHCVELDCVAHVLEGHAASTCTVKVNTVKR